MLTRRTKNKERRFYLQYEDDDECADDKTTNARHDKLATSCGEHTLNAIR